MGNESSQMQPPEASQHPHTTLPAPIAASSEQRDFDMDENHTDSDRAQDSYIEQLINNEPGNKPKKDKNFESRAKIREALAERLDLAESQLLLLTEKSSGRRGNSTLTAGQKRILQRSQSRVEKITAAMTKWDKNTSKIARKQEKRRAVVPEVAHKHDMEDVDPAEPVAVEDENVIRESTKRGSKRKKKTTASVIELPVEGVTKRKRAKSKVEGHQGIEPSASEARNDEASEVLRPPQEESERQPEVESSERPDDEAPQISDAERGEEPATHHTSTEIPTPPESHHDSADAASEASEIEAVTLEDNEISALSEGEINDNRPTKGKRTRSVVSASGSTEEQQPGRSRKRMRKSQHREDDEEEYLDSASSDQERVEPRSKRARKLKSDHREDEARFQKSAGAPALPSDIIARMEWSERPTTAAGPFTAAERDIADRVFKEVLRMDRLSEAELKTKIKDWRRAGTFRVEIEAALPARPKASVRKFCQRKYHTNERGPWTAEQDEALRNAYAQYPGEWTKLSDLVDRHPGDCKDRWTLHLQYGDKRETGPWSKDEEEKLLTAVKECIAIIKKDNRGAAKDREYIESLISWKVVAEKLGLTRSTKACREKYDKIKSRATKSKQAAIIEDDQKEISTKRARAEAAVKEFEIGDFYDVFTEIHESFDDTTKSFHDELNVVYAVTSAKHPASRFSLVQRDRSVRRVALETALKEWKIDSKKFQRRLEKAETIPAQAKVLARWLEKQYTGRLHAMARTFRTDWIGKSADEIAKIKRERSEAWYAIREAIANGTSVNASAKPGKMKSKSSSMSKEFVMDSSDDEADILRDPESSGDEADEQQQADAKPARATKDDDEEMNDDDQGQDKENQESDDDETGLWKGDSQNGPYSVRIPIPRVASDEPGDAKLPPSATTARFAEGLTGEPNLAPSDFLKRCRKAGNARDKK